MYKKEDLIQISYSEFGLTMDDLVGKIKDYQTGTNTQFNLIVPLLRSGAFPAFHIAARLEIKNVLPVYYMYQKGSIVKRLEIPKTINSLPDNLNVLICDSCLVSGTTLKTALTELKVLFPKANFYAAVAWLEEGMDSITGIEKIFYGKRTNEKGACKSPECINGLVVAPWEDFEIDWNEVKDY